MRGVLLLRAAAAGGVLLLAAAGVLQLVLAAAGVAVALHLLGPALLLARRAGEPLLRALLQLCAAGRRLPAEGGLLLDAARIPLAGLVEEVGRRLRRRSSRAPEEPCAAHHGARGHRAAGRGSGGSRRLLSDQHAQRSLEERACEETFRRGGRRGEEEGPSLSATKRQAGEDGNV